MPAYEYRCQACGGILTVYHRIGDAPAVEKCPDCDSDAERVFGAASFIWDGGKERVKAGVTLKMEREKSVAAMDRFIARHPAWSRENFHTRDPS